jgi:hypothetical protein
LFCSEETEVPGSKEVTEGLKKGGEKIQSFFLELVLHQWTVCSWLLELAHLEPGYVLVL